MSHLIAIAYPDVHTATTVDKMAPGSAALFLLVDQSPPDKVIPQVSQYGGHIIQTSLSQDKERHLRDTAEALKA